jgi:hypothetical protein
MAKKSNGKAITAGALAEELNVNAKHLRATIRTLNAKNAMFKHEKNARYALSGEIVKQLREKFAHRIADKKAKTAKKKIVTMKKAS